MNYESKELWQFMYNIRKTDTLIRLSPMILFLIAYTLAVVYIELEIIQISTDSWLKNLPALHGLLSFVISLLLVFRTNTAYDRWWEGRKLLGSLVNNSRNFAIKIDAILPDDEIENRQFFRKLIPMYSFALKDHLRSNKTKYSLDESEDGDTKLFEMDYNKHIPNQIAKQLFGRINRLHLEAKINGDQLIVLNGEISSFTDICGACERILNTPIPVRYRAFIKRFILLYILTLPWG